jgi:hypothetical protein
MARQTDHRSFVVELRTPLATTYPSLHRNAWVPDTRQPGFADECRRHCKQVARADQGDPGLNHLMETASADVEGWST